MNNYYKLLGVNKKASKQQINAAFKRLSLKYHPDRTGGDPYSVELFKELNEAKQVLSNEERRAEHDLELKNGSFPRVFFKRREEYISPGEQMQTGGYGRKRMGTLQWLVMVVGLAVAIMFILIAIDNATTIFSKDREKFLQDKEFSNGSLFLPGDNNFKHYK